MNTSQKLIIRDYLKRKRWHYFMGFSIHFLAMSMGWPLFLGLLPCSALLLTLELMRKGSVTPRTLLSLPISADQLGRCWHFVSFSFPALVCLLILTVATATRTSLGKDISGEEFFFYAGMQTGLLGMLFFLLTGLPAQLKDSSSFKQWILKLLFRVIWLLPYPGFFIFSLVSLPGNVAEMKTGHFIAGLLLVAMIIAGWFWAGNIARWQTGRGFAEPVKKTTIQKAGQPWKRVGALPYFLMRSGFTPVCAPLLMIGLFWTIPWLTGSGRIEVPIIITMKFITPFVGYMAITIIIPQLRVLRSLPLSRATITHFLLFWPLALIGITALICLGVDALMNSGRFSPVKWLEMIPTTVAFCLSIPLMLRFGLKMWIASPFFLLALFFPFSGNFIRCPLPVAGTLLSAVWISNYLLLGSPHPWRAGAFRRSMASL